MQCPILKKEMGKTCGNKYCLYHSLILDNGCFHGKKTDAAQLALHKNLKPGDIRKEIREKNRVFIRYITLYRYLEYVQGSEPDVNTEIIYHDIKNS